MTNTGSLREDALLVSDGLSISGTISTLGGWPLG